MKTNFVNLSEEELKRVITQTKAGLLMARESIVSRSQKIGGDILAYNHVVSEEELLDKISGYSKKQITDFAGKMIVGSKLNFSAIGKVKNINTHQKISQNFK